MAAWAGLGSSVRPGRGVCAFAGAGDDTGRTARKAVPAPGQGMGGGEWRRGGGRAEARPGSNPTCWRGCGPPCAGLALGRAGGLPQAGAPPCPCAWCCARSRAAPGWGAGPAGRGVLIWGRGGGGEGMSAGLRDAGPPHIALQRQEPSPILARARAPAGCWLLTPARQAAKRCQGRLRGAAGSTTHVSHDTVNGPHTHPSPQHPHPSTPPFKHPPGSSPLPLPLRVRPAAAAAAAVAVVGPGWGTQSAATRRATCAAAAASMFCAAAVACTLSVLERPLLWPPLLPKELSREGPAWGNVKK